MSKKNKIIILAALLSLFLIILWWANRDLTMTVSYDGEISANVDSEIIIQRDNSGLAYVKTKTINDAYFAIGFLHGKDRLILIEYFRAIAAGKLSELIGKEGLQIDKLSRAIRFVKLADKLALYIQNPYKEYLKSYSHGINAAKHNYYNDISAISNIPPAKWTINDVLSILLLYEWSDSYLNNKELLFPLPASIPQRILTDIIPDDLIYNYSILEERLVARLRDIRSAIKKHIGTYGGGLAFYIGGGKVRNGKSIVGFNLDSELSLYPKWYPLYIEVSDFKIACITTSGLPFIFLGKNNNISFLGFNLNIDTQDFFAEKTRNSDDAIQYFNRGQWKNFKTRDEIIFSNKDRDEKNQARMRLRDTDTGPLISDIFNDGIRDNHFISLKSILPKEDYITALFEIPFSTDLHTARKYLKNIFSLPRVYLLASNERAILAYSGKVPQRSIRWNIFKKGGTQKWNGLLDLSGFNKLVSNKNIIVGDRSYERLPDAIRKYAVPQDRNRYSRLKELIEKDKLIEIKEIANVLSDLHSPVAEKYIPVFNSILENIPTTSAKLSRIYFNHWNFLMDTESVSATIFNSLLINMIRETVSDEFENSTDGFMEHYDIIIDKYYEMLISNRSFLFDDTITRVNIENRNNIFTRAFSKSMRELNEFYGPRMENWKWGAAHYGSYNLPLIKRGLFYDKKFNGTQEEKIDGGNSTISRGTVNTTGMPGAGTVSSISGIVHSDLSFIAPSFSCPMDMHSKYYKNYYKNNDHICLDLQKFTHKLRVVPLTNNR